MRLKVALLPGLIVSLLVLHPEFARAQDDAAALKSAVNSSTRRPEDVARDQYRHPIETLTFFGIKPDMTVVEMSPGGGW